jgi:hypothetical protein
MCWACEQDRFWAAYTEYMAAKQAANGKAGTEIPVDEDARGLVLPLPCGEGGEARSAEPGGGLADGE